MKDVGRHIVRRPQGHERSHNGAMSLGRGAIGCKQKLNTKSSAKAELVGISIYLPNTIWARMFLEAQGHTLQSNVLAQDNYGAMQVAHNGRGRLMDKSRSMSTFGISSPAEKGRTPHRTLSESS
ncbi:hypothetical protein ACA910_008491 [Epithemia clementina (nom. ined.)]